MIKRVLAVSLMGLSLAGCVNNDSLSGDVYTASEAKQVQNVTYGTIVNVRPVQIQGGDDSNVIGAIGGAVLGGFLGNTIGGGTGRSLATAAGAVAGGVAGQGVQSAMNKTQGVELEIRKDDGNTIMVVQNKEYAFLGRSACRAGQQRQPGYCLSTLNQALRVVTWPHVCPCTSIVRVQFHNIVFKFGDKFNQKLNLL